MAPFPRRLPAAVVALATLLAAAGCRDPKYVRYASPYADFTAMAPHQWSVVLDPGGSDYYNITLAGPLEPDFYKGVPSFSIRWYKYNAAHRLPDGNFESYSSADDYMTQMLRDVYGPEAQTYAGADDEVDEALKKQVAMPKARKIAVSGHEALYFVVFRDLPAPKGQVFGVVITEKGERYVVQRHAYAIVPMKEGFYSLIYPATRPAFEKFRPQFWTLLNTLRIHKEGPAGPMVKAPPEKAGKPSAVLP